MGHIHTSWERTNTAAVYEAINQQIEYTETDRFFMVEAMLTHESILNWNNLLSSRKELIRRLKDMYKSRGIEVLFDLNDLCSCDV